MNNRTKATIRLAEKGYDTGQNSLGVAYAKGVDLPQDFTKAVYWYTKAANQGYPMAMRNLARAYKNGRGVGENIELAMSWWSKADEIEKRVFG